MDKSKWPKGEWIDEEDTFRWIDQRTGFKCYITRRPDLGVLELHVGVPKPSTLERYDPELVVYNVIVGNRPITFFNHKLPGIDFKKTLLVGVAMTTINDYIPLQGQVARDSDSTAHTRYVAENLAVLKTLQLGLAIEKRVLNEGAPPTYKNIDYCIQYSRSLCDFLNGRNILDV